ncbi:MAG: O-antigen ligase family protein [Aliarcobacter sp.]|jgi:O-antigen ligase|nr:O-antigen ligase family protein [Aliarcobacter sp.]
MNKILTFENTFNFVFLIWMIAIPFKNAIYQITTVLLIGMFFVYISKNRAFRYIKTILYIYKDMFFVFLLILISMTISNLINNSTSRAWVIELSYIYRYIFVLFILFYFYTKDFFSKNTLVLFILISLGIQALNGLYQAFVGYDFFKQEVGNLKVGLTGGTFNRNVFCIFMGLGVLISFFVLKAKLELKIKYLLSLFLLLFIFCTLFSYSRSVWIALFIGFWFYLFLNFKNIRTINLLYFFVVFIVFGLIFYNVDTLSHRFNLLIQGYSSHRYEIWLHSLNLFLQKPLFGWGLDVWNFNGYKNFANVHNSILEILLNIGLFGLVSFILFILLTLREIKNTKNIYLFIILVFFIVVSFFEQSILTSKTFITSIVLLVFFVFSNRLDNIRSKGEIK